jgi:hypothetical protein
MSLLSAILISVLAGFIAAMLFRNKKRFSWLAFWIALFIVLGGLHLIAGLAVGAFIISVALTVLLIKLFFLIALIALIVVIVKAVRR